MSEHKQVPYRDELIRRLQQEGAWQCMTESNRSRFENISEGQARGIMVLEDQWTIGEQDAVNTLGLFSLVKMIQSFRGALVELDGEDIGKLSKAGRLLAEFIIELSNKGVASRDVDEGLQKLSPFVIAALIASYELTP